MEVIVGKYSGFCAGVKSAMKRAEQSVQEQDVVYSLGEFVHNERVVSDLERNGMITVQSLEKVPDFSVVIFRAHGEASKNYQLALKKHLQIIDLTCGKIQVIRQKLNHYKDSSFIIMIGKKEHPEMVGNLSYIEDDVAIISSEEDITEELLHRIACSKKENVYVISQTTFSSSLFDLFVQKLQEVIDKDLIIDKTICDATEKRQNETRKLARQVDCMIVIGGKHSSNTRELYEIAKKELENVYCIQEAKDLSSYSFDFYSKIGIMAGASTPDVVVQEVIQFLKQENIS